MPLHQLYKVYRHSPIRVIFTSIFVLILLCTSLVPSVLSQADDTKGSVEYKFISVEDSEGLVISLNILKIADVTVDGTGIKIVPLYENIDESEFFQPPYDSEDDSKNAASRRSYCEDLVEQLRGEAWDSIKLVGESGIIEDLDLGVYLIADLDVENEEFTVSPFLIQVPYSDGRSITYNVPIEIKVFQVLIYCEVYKDTIKRTSAAYESLPGKEGINNVGDETYRVDINFRSTSNVDADEFVVDDPLECVRLDQVRLESLWTPVVFGDIDGFFYLWYKTNLTDDSVMYHDITASDVPNPQYSNRGFKLWSNNGTKSQAISNDDPTAYSATYRMQLNVSDLGLQEGEYITALRFDFGAVEKGFTSMNKSRTTKNDEHRDTSKSEVTLPSVNDQEIDRIDISDITGAYESTPNFFASFFNMFTIDAMAADTNGFEYPNSIYGNKVDWIPKAERHDFNPEALKAQGLQPISYMVVATKAMNDAEIVSSAISRIAKSNMKDADQDAIVTKVIPTLQFDDEIIPEPPSEEMFPEEAATTSPRLRVETVKPNPNVRVRPQTGDETQVILYVMLGVGAVALIMVLLVLKKRQGKKQEMKQEE